MKKLVIMLLLFTAVSVRAESVDKPITATLEDDGVQRASIIAGSYFFKPSHIIVRVNLPVELTVGKESGFIPHNIIVNEADAGIVFDEDLSTDPKIIRFTPLKTGKYPIYCGKKLLFFESHREKGMEGVLEVVQ